MQTQKRLTQQSRWWWAAARSGWWCPQTSSSPPPTWWSHTWRSQSRSPRGTSPSLAVSVCQGANTMSVSVRGESSTSSVWSGLEKSTSTPLWGDCWSVSLNIWWSGLMVGSSASPPALIGWDPPKQTSHSFLWKCPSLSFLLISSTTKKIRDTRMTFPFLLCLHSHCYRRTLVHLRHPPSNSHGSPF